MDENVKDALDRYYSKMKTPVEVDPEKDRLAIERMVADAEGREARKLIPGSDLEMEKPKLLDILGFVGTFALCFLIIGLAIWMAGLGA